MIKSPIKPATDNDGKGVEYEIQLHYHPYIESPPILAIRDKITTRFGREIDKSITSISNLDLVLNIFQIPRNELERLFPTEGEMEKMLIPLFILYCEGFLRTMEPRLRKRENAPKRMMSCGLKLEDVYAGMQLYLEYIKNQNTLHEIIQKRENRFDLRDALTYLRGNWEDFMEFILDETSKIIEDTDVEIN